MRRLTLFVTLVAASFAVFGASGASASVVCSPTGFTRDGMALTAAIVNPVGPVTGDVDGTGCNIAVYYGPDAVGTFPVGTGTVDEANVHGSNYYGVVAAGAAVNVSDSHVYAIGENPFNGSQHGVGVFYTTLEGNEFGNDNTQIGTSATGTLSGSTVDDYQKNGVVVNGVNAVANVTGNTVAGEGPITYIAQNGVQFSRGGAGSVTKNLISDQFYSPPDVEACGLLFFNSGAVKSSGNKFRADELNICNFGGRGGGNFSP
jgi:hypothetical protein